MENGKLKICVYAISKNEEMFVERFCNAAKDADMIMIADTGSVDGTVERATQNGAVVHNICISPWRFDHARNAALALVPSDVDICVSLDLDEVLQPGWREEIERVWVKGETTRLRYMFDWGCGIAFKYEKIHARKGYHWHHPCHEYPVPDGRITEVWADTDMLLVIHKPDPSKSRGQYLDLLELSVKEDPDCPRNAFYYARELSFHSRWRESIEACERYLKLPRANWPNERCYAYRVMGRCYTDLGDQWNAERAFQMAAYESPNTREPWCEMAMLMYRQHRWEECFAAAIRALKITDREMVYTVDPEVWGHQPHDLLSISAWHLGFKDLAIKHAKICVELTPSDPRLQSNLDFLLKEQANGVQADTQSPGSGWS
jgi:glycosyltransferase involved in cell wall biosynthesis